MTLRVDAVRRSDQANGVGLTPDAVQAARLTRLVDRDAERRRRTAGGWPAQGIDDA